MTRPSPLAAMAVFVGGSLGTGLRWALTELSSGSVPLAWALVAVNVTGAFALGLLLGRRSSPMHTLFLGTGFLGGFTTYSAFAGELTLAGNNGEFTNAAAQLLATVVLGVAAARLGLRLGAPR